MTSYIPFVAKEDSKASDSLRVRMPPEQKVAWIELCDRKKISQQDAVTSLLQWLLEQEDIVQSMVIGQTAPDSELVDWILHRLAERRGGGHRSPSSSAANLQSTRSKTHEKTARKTPGDESVGKIGPHTPGIADGSMGMAAMTDQPKRDGPLNR